jgi:FAD/FMN-containing dehydrogenase
MTGLDLPAVDDLAATFEGQLLREGDAGYDEARVVFNGCIDRRPALIARCTSTADVQAAVDYARQADIVVAVRGGGHSPQGFSVWDDSLMVDLSPMKGIEIDAQTRTVRAQPGLTWGEFDAATQEHGLAITGGRFSTTGISGLTLGSGSGWLERRCGLTSDNLLAAEVVTADGSVVTASSDENSDLLWGLCGGSGNFGIVTSFTYRMYEIGPIIFGGMMVALPDRAVEILRFLRDYMPSAPDDFNCTPAFVSAPPEPDIPEAMHFAPVVGLVVCWTGPLEEGEPLLAPVREVAQPVMEKVGPMPYTALQTMLDASAPYPTRSYLKAEFLPDLTENAIDKLATFGNGRPSPMTQLIVEPMGGAIRRTGAERSALRGRDAGWCFHALAMWTDPSEEAEREHVTWARGLAQEIVSETMDGVYLNFTSDTGEERVRSAYGPERYARLVALKDRYDPANLFHLNQNIPPSNGAGGSV